jgi:amino acid permease
MSDLNYHRDRASRDSFKRTTRSVIIAVLVLSIVVGVFVYSSVDSDKSSAVRNDPPQAEMIP